MKRIKKTYPTRCGLEFNSSPKRLKHRKECEICHPAGAEPVGAIPIIFTSRCGLDFWGRRKMKAHQQDCQKCKDIKRENIRKRQLKHNQSEAQRQAASRAAIYTSKRKDLLEQRTNNLARWREQNPDKFRRSTEAAQKANKRSKFEAWMKDNILIEFEHSVQIRCQETLKQVDFVKDNIWIEIDGPHHFFTVHKYTRNGKNRLEYTQGRDKLLGDECLRRQNISLVRLSFMCFHNSTGRLKDEWKTILTQILHYPKLGIWCLGELYESCPWVNDKCTILKSPTPNTTSSYPTEL